MDKHSITTMSELICFELTRENLFENYRLAIVSFKL